MESADFLIVGGGVAGLSAAAQLAPHGRAIVLEAEEATGYHSSGRSAAFSHFGIGNAIVRALTVYSRETFIAVDGLSRRSTALFVANDAMRPTLAALASEMATFTGGIRAVGDAEMHTLCPALRLGPEAVVAGVIDPDGLRLDSHAMLQHFTRCLRDHAGDVRTDARVARIDHNDRWTVETDRGDRFAAPVLINAAGAWADQIAALAGIAPLGLAPLRRTIIVVDPPAGADARDWAFVKTAVDDFYILPEGGRLMASPVDEVPCDPCDAQPEDYDIALAAAKVEEWTTLPVTRIAHRWAGLRTFTADRTPAVGFSAEAPGYFWLAGQGGFGLQTAPAVAEIVESLIAGTPWPDELTRAGVTQEALDPARFA